MCVVVLSGAPTIRTLKLHLPDDPLPALDTFLKQTKEARVFRRAQAVREVVKGQRLQTVSDTLHLTYSALRKWVHRFARHGVQSKVLTPSPLLPPSLRIYSFLHLDWTGR
jgi:Homeodomain-like domain-containing protein